MSQHRSQSWNAQALSVEAIASSPDRLRRQEIEFISPKSERLFTFRALEAAAKHALRLPRHAFTRGRTVIFSDLHLGDKNARTDDFRHNERTYCQALEHYLGHDYRLILNGDVEEGWKASYGTIIEAYESTVYRLEAEFARRGPDHYYRIYGNHDEDWADPRKVMRYLSPAIGQPVEVHPALLIGDQILITHGHQGDLNSDRRAWFSRRIVRHVWRPLQRVLKLSNRNASQMHVFRRTREQCLYEWAHHNRRLLIAGHTHRPMFDSLAGHRRHSGWLDQANDQLSLTSHTQPGASASDLADPPHYLNVGCCVHTDGITGLEIEHGELRLIRWHANAAVSGATGIQRSVLKSADLGAVLARL